MSEAVTPRDPRALALAVLGKSDSTMMQLTQAVTALEKATAPADLIATAKAMGLA